ncbi:hypothetical protein ACYJ1Y_08540 [Natrialbaceae archaeon A-gly3]
MDNQGEQRRDVLVAVSSGCVLFVGSGKRGTAKPPLEDSGYGTGYGRGYVLE